MASQRDTEQADIEKERQQQAKGPEAQAHELEELAEIYEQRGVSKELARQVLNLARRRCRGDWRLLFTGMGRVAMGAAEAQSRHGGSSALCRCLPQSAELCGSTYLGPAFLKLHCT